MSIRILPIVAVGVLGIALGASIPHLARTARSSVGSDVSGSPQDSGEKEHDGHAHRPGEARSTGSEGLVRLSPERLSAAGITVVPAGRGVIARSLMVPGAIVPDSNRIVRVAAKVVGTVAELTKQLGDPVAKGEIVAVLDSREVAEAKSEYLAALANYDLQKTLFERGLSLYQAKVTPENQFLRAQTAFTEAQLRHDLARHKLSALTVADAEIAALSRTATALQRYEVRSPIAGRVVERLVNLGASVGIEGQAKELYVVADLSSVWIDLAIPTLDLAGVKEGQSVMIESTDAREPSEGKVVFISPTLNQETRSARVIAALDNRDLAWRPGSFVTARVVLERQPVTIALPRTAVQTISGEQVVFVQTAEGFEKREIVPGRSDETTVEVAFGVDPGQPVAVTNTFVLKAELGKSEAEHSH